ncbi:MAG TPA: biotin--[acetyl-CoA-carboxylase] ligase [Longimicrobiales bacterium]|nr:biotin--[acetyl-CoA-carboxylase] ligase [Longimicrobiales bacterium]
MEAGATWAGRTAREWAEVLGAPAVRVERAVPSTNDVARAWAEDGGPAGAVVLAETQSAGRGRSGRPWWSPPGVSLYGSWILRPPRPAGGADPGLVSLRVGLALALAIEEAYGLVPRLKWPNDLLAEDGRKLAGVLCEAALTGPAPSYVIAGIGLNVCRPAGPPPSLRTSAASIAEVLDRDVDRAAILQPLSARMLVLASAPSGPLDAVDLARWGERDALVGLPILIDGRPAGRAAGVDATGGLLVEDRGRVNRVYTGTVRVAENEAVRWAGTREGRSS